MDFAKKQLQKYGWEEGKGLGKHENGITKAIKPSLKFDGAGIGHSVGKEFMNNWWDKVYNEASKNVKIKNDKGNVEMDLVNEDSVEITTKDYSVKDFKKKNKHLEYGTFLKTTKLTPGGEIRFQDVVIPEETALYTFTTIPDDVLYAACEGRTAHKGARHGVKMSGKLSRIERQEKMLMKKLQKVSLSDDENLKANKKLKKLSKHSKSEEKEEESTSQVFSEKKKKKKKKRKSVSFNETVTEYHTQELDTSSQSNESGDQLIILESAINDSEGFEDLNLQDEGIEQDCDMRSEDLGQQSFEEVQKSKKEKKKKKKAALVVVEDDPDCIDEDPPIVKEKKSRATQKFLDAILDDDSMEKYKRKHDEDDLSKNFKKHCDGVSSKCLKKKKKKKRQETTINSIVASLDKESEDTFKDDPKKFKAKSKSELRASTNSNSSGLHRSSKERGILYGCGLLSDSEGTSSPSKIVMKNASSQTDKDPSMRKDSRTIWKQAKVENIAASNFGKTMEKSNYSAKTQSGNIEECKTNSKKSRKGKHRKASSSNSNLIMENTNTYNYLVENSSNICFDPAYLGEEFCNCKCETNAAELAFDKEYQKNGIFEQTMQIEDLPSDSSTETASEVGDSQNSDVNKGMDLELIKPGFDNAETNKESDNEISTDLELTNSYTSETSSDESGHVHKQVKKVIKTAYRQLFKIRSPVYAKKNTSDSDESSANLPNLPKFVRTNSRSSKRRKSKHKDESTATFLASLKVGPKGEPLMQAGQINKSPIVTKEIVEQFVGNFSEKTKVNNNKASKRVSFMKGVTIIKDYSTNTKGVWNKRENSVSDPKANSKRNKPVKGKKGILVSKHKESSKINPGSAMIYNSNKVEFQNMQKEEKRLNFSGVEDTNISLQDLKYRDVGIQFNKNIESEKQNTDKFQEEVKSRKRKRVHPNLMKMTSAEVNNYVKGVLGCNIGTESLHSDSTEGSSDDSIELNHCPYVGKKLEVKSGFQSDPTGVIGMRNQMCINCIDSIVDILNAERTNEKKAKFEEKLDKTKLVDKIPDKPNQEILNARREDISHQNASEECNSRKKDLRKPPNIEECQNMKVRSSRIRKKKLKYLQTKQKLGQGGKNGKIEEIPKRLENTQEEIMKALEKYANDSNLNSLDSFGFRDFKDKIKTVEVTEAKQPYSGNIKAIPNDDLFPVGIENFKVVQAVKYFGDAIFKYVGRSCLPDELYCGKKQDVVVNIITALDQATKGCTIIQNLLVSGQIADFTEICKGKIEMSKFIAKYPSQKGLLVAALDRGAKLINEFFINYNANYKIKKYGLQREVLDAIKKGNREHLFNEIIDYVVEQKRIRKAISECKKDILNDFKHPQLIIVKGVPLPKGATSPLDMGINLKNCANCMFRFVAEDYEFPNPNEIGHVHDASEFLKLWKELTTSNFQDLPPNHVYSSVKAVAGISDTANINIKGANERDKQIAAKVLEYLFNTVYRYGIDDEKIKDDPLDSTSLKVDLNGQRKQSLTETVRTMEDVIEGVHEFFFEGVHIHENMVNDRSFKNIRLCGSKGNNYVVTDTMGRKLHFLDHLLTRKIYDSTEMIDTILIPQDAKAVSCRSEELETKAVSSSSEKLDIKDAYCKSEKLDIKAANSKSEKLDASPCLDTSRIYFERIIDWLINEVRNGRGNASHEVYLVQAIRKLVQESKKDQNAAPKTQIYKSGEIDSSRIEKFIQWLSKDVQHSNKDLITPDLPNEQECNIKSSDKFQTVIEWLVDEAQHGNSAGKVARDLSEVLKRMIQERKNNKDESHINLQKTDENCSFSQVLTSADHDDTYQTFSDKSTNKQIVTKKGTIKEWLQNSSNANNRENIQNQDIVDSGIHKNTNINNQSSELKLDDDATIFKCEEHMKGIEKAQIEPNKMSQQSMVEDSDTKDAVNASAVVFGIRQCKGVKSNIQQVIDHIRRNPTGTKGMQELATIFKNLLTDISKLESLTGKMNQSEKQDNQDEADRFLDVNQHIEHLNKYIQSMIQTAKVNPIMKSVKVQKQIEKIISAITSGCQCIGIKTDSKIENNDAEIANQRNHMLERNVALNNNPQKMNQKNCKTNLQNKVVEPDAQSKLNIHEHVEISPQKVLEKQDVSQKKNSEINTTKLNKDCQKPKVYDNIEFKVKGEISPEKNWIIAKLLKDAQHALKISIKGGTVDNEKLKTCSEEEQITYEKQIKNANVEAILRQICHNTQNISSATIIDRNVSKEEKQPIRENKPSHSKKPEECGYMELLLTKKIILSLTHNEKKCTEDFYRFLKKYQYSEIVVDEELSKNIDPISKELTVKCTAESKNEQSSRYNEVSAISNEPNDVLNTSQNNEITAEPNDTLCNIVANSDIQKKGIVNNEWSQLDNVTVRLGCNDEIRSNCENNMVVSQLDGCGVLELSRKVNADNYEELEATNMCQCSLSDNSQMVDAFKNSTEDKELITSRMDGTEELEANIIDNNGYIQLENNAEINTDISIHCSLRCKDEKLESLDDTGCSSENKITYSQLENTNVSNTKQIDDYGLQELSRNNNKTEKCEQSKVTNNTSQCVSRDSSQIIDSSLKTCTRHEEVNVSRRDETEELLPNCKPTLDNVLKIQVVDVARTNDEHENSEMMNASFKNCLQHEEHVESKRRGTEELLTNCNPIIENVFEVQVVDVVRSNDEEDPKNLQQTELTTCETGKADEGYGPGDEKDLNAQEQVPDILQNDERKIFKCSKENSIEHKQLMISRRHVTEELEVSVIDNNGYSQLDNNAEINKDITIQCSLKCKDEKLDNLDNTGCNSENKITYSQLENDSVSNIKQIDDCGVQELSRNNNEAENCEQSTDENTCQNNTAQCVFSDSSQIIDTSLKTCIQHDKFCTSRRDETEEFMPNCKPTLDNVLKIQVVDVARTNDEHKHLEHDNSEMMNAPFKNCLQSEERMESKSEGTEKLLTNCKPTIENVIEVRVVDVGQSNDEEDIKNLQHTELTTCGTFETEKADMGYGPGDENNLNAQEQVLDVLQNDERKTLKCSKENSIEHKELMTSRTHETEEFEVNVIDNNEFSQLENDAEINKDKTIHCSLKYKDEKLESLDDTESNSENKITYSQLENASVSNTKRIDDCGVQELSRNNNEPENCEQSKDENTCQNKTAQCVPSSQIINKSLKICIQHQELSASRRDETEELLPNCKPTLDNVPEIKVVDVTRTNDEHDNSEMINALFKNCLQDEEHVESKSQETEELLTNCKPTIKNVDVYVDQSNDKEDIKNLQHKELTFETEKADKEYEPGDENSPNSQCQVLDVLQNDERKTFKYSKQSEDDVNNFPVEEAIQCTRSNIPIRAEQDELDRLKENPENSIKKYVQENIVNTITNVNDQFEITNHTYDTKSETDSKFRVNEAIDKIDQKNELYYKKKYETIKATKNDDRGSLPLVSSFISNTEDNRNESQLSPKGHYANQVTEIQSAPMETEELDFMKSKVTDVHFERDSNDAEEDHAGIINHSAQHFVPPAETPDLNNNKHGQLKSDHGTGNREANSIQERNGNNLEADQIIDSNNNADEQQNQEYAIDRNPIIHIHNDEAYVDFWGYVSNKKDIADTISRAENKGLKPVTISFNHGNDSENTTTSYTYRNGETQVPSNVQELSNLVTDENNKSLFIIHENMNMNYEANKRAVFYHDQTRDTSALPSQIEVTHALNFQEENNVASAFNPEQLVMNLIHENEQRNDNIEVTNTLHDNGDQNSVINQEFSEVSFVLEDKQSDNIEETYVSHTGAQQNCPMNSEIPAINIIDDNAEITNISQIGTQESSDINSEISFDSSQSALENNLIISHFITERNFGRNRNSNIFVIPTPSSVAEADGDEDISLD